MPYRPFLSAALFCAAAIPGLAAGTPTDTAAAEHAAIAAERHRAAAAPRPRTDFLLRSPLRSVALAPDGRHVAWLLDDGRTRSAWVMPTAGDAPRRLLPATEAGRLLWTRDGRWLLLVSDRALFALGVDGQPGGGLVTPLGGADERELLAVDPARPAAAIVLEHGRATPDAARRWRLLRVDLHGARTVLHEDARRLTDAAFAADGSLAYLQRVEDEHLAILRADAHGLAPVVRCERLHRCSLLPRVAADGALWMTSDLAADRAGLVRLAPDGTHQRVHADPRNEADIDTVATDPVDGRPLVAHYRGGEPAGYGVTAEAARHVAALDRQLPGRDLAITVGQARWLVGERASTLQETRWHLYDPATGALRHILDEAPRPVRSGVPAPDGWLPEAALAPKIPVAWSASDGLRLHGFLTLPPGTDPARVPLVVHPHGGPWSHTRPDYSGFVQFLANRGYAVFEPNFRGSTGYGRAYLFAARGDFGDGRVQQDIVEGTRALLARGIGDPARVGIAGASFGGYAALLGVTGSPDLFKVGIAGVPPPDFGWNLRWVARSREALALSRSIGFEAWMRLVDLDLADPATLQRLSAASPLANAARMDRPLLLFAGGEDRRVAVRGVVEYAAQLKQLGKDISLYVDPEAGHALEDPVSREAWLYLAERMLAQHLGGEEPAPPDAELRRYLDRSARIEAPGLRQP